MGKRYAPPVKAAYLSDIVQQTNRVAAKVKKTRFK